MNDTAREILAKTAAISALALGAILLYLSGCEPDRAAPPDPPPPAPVPTARRLTIGWDPYTPGPGFAAIRIYRGTDLCDAPEPLPALPSTTDPDAQAAVVLAEDGTVATTYIDDTVPAVPGLIVCYELDAVNEDGTPSLTRSNRASIALS